MANWTFRNIAAGSDVVVDDAVTNILPYFASGLYTVKIQPPSTIPATTMAAGANNGGTPPAPVVAAGSTDKRGSATFGSGTTPAAGAQCVVTFGSPQSSYGSVSVTAKNTATQALGLYVSSASTTGFTVSSTAIPTASQANTVFSIDYAFTP